MPTAGEEKERRAIELLKKELKLQKLLEEIADEAEKIGDMGNLIGIYGREGVKVITNDGEHDSTMSKEELKPAFSGMGFSPFTGDAKSIDGLQKAKSSLWERLKKFAIASVEYSKILGRLPPFGVFLWYPEHQFGTTSHEFYAFHEEGARKRGYPKKLGITFAIHKDNIEHSCEKLMQVDADSLVCDCNDKDFCIKNKDCPFRKLGMEDTMRITVAQHEFSRLAIVKSFKPIPNIFKSFSKNYFSKSI